MIKRILFFITCMIMAVTCNATSVSTAVNANFYVSIPENAGGGFTVTPFLPVQCVFSATQPTLSTVGHRIAQAEVWAVNSTTLALWCKSEATNVGANFVSTTVAGDASINGAGGSGTTTAVTQSGTWNINNVTGTVSLPTGAATAAKQPALGTAGTASSNVITIQGIASMVPLLTNGSGFTQPVSGTFWQATQPISATSLPLPTGASTDTLQAAGNASLSTLATNLPAQGLAATAASTPISLSKDVEIDASGTIAAGGTSQTLRAATAADKSIEIYNNDSTEPLCFKYGTTATLTTQGSYCIPALGYYSNTISNQRVDIIATTTGHKFTSTVRQ